MLGADEFAAWFRLLEAPGVGRAAARRLLAACGSPERVLAAGPGLWREVGGADAAAGLAQAPSALDGRLTAALQWLSSGEDRAALSLGDPAYPALLMQTADPPLLLYTLGLPAQLAKPGVAVVGSRRATPQGEANARAFAEALSNQSWAVVSGLAQGIDGAAHEGALQGPGGTVAVVGTGLDRIYPPKHKALAHRIAQQGCIVSEYPPGTPALPEHFPQRNRIIAGLSLGTLVVEAALQSGSLITARLASEAGREVFAIPGSIHSPQAKGCHALLKQGAKLVESAEDILEDLRASRARPAQASEPEAQATLVDDPLLRALGHDPVSLDTLLGRTGWPVADLSAQLLTLELEGLIARLPGGLFQALHRT
jgi:DNA processing protein